VDDLTWEFRLREGLRFHDDTPFGAEDVAFSFARVPHLPNSPGPFTPMFRTVADHGCAQAMRAATDDPGVIASHYLRVNRAAQRARVRYDARAICCTNALLASPAE